MTGRIAEMWRHPIKSHGRERIGAATLAAGRALPGDRAWAVAHEDSGFDPDNPAWAPCREFTRCATLPRLQQITCSTDPDSGKLTLSHPDLPDLTIAPGEEGRDLVEWVTPVSDGGRARPARLVRAPETAMTDTDYQSISLINLASHRALETHLGQALSPLRWRGNLLVEGLEPWEESGWIGRTLAIGPARFEVVEPIRRCRATEANPQTGIRDAETLKGLREGFGHQDCGVYLKVIRGGEIAEGMEIEVLS